MAEDIIKDKYFIFTIGTKYYAIYIKYVLEIIGIDTITIVPDLSSDIKGVINLKGNIIPVIDVRQRFEKEEKKYDERTCVIVISMSNESIGFVVHEAIAVINITEDEIAIPPEFKSIYKNRYIKGICKLRQREIMLLNCERFIDCESEKADKVFKEWSYNLGKILNVW